MYDDYDEYYDEYEEEAGMGYLAPEPVEYLFVYGTMKRDFRNHSRISNDISTKYLGDHVTAESIFQMKSKLVCDGKVAPVVLRHGKDAITGELYQISASLLEYVDLMEGHPSVYKRGMVKLKNVKYPAWMYVVESNQSFFSPNHVLIENSKATYIES